MNSLLLKKASRVVAWTMTVATSVWLAAPQAAIAATPTYKFKWVSQTPGTITADGKAHYVTANQGQSVTLSLTVQNLTGETIKAKSSLPAAPAGYQVPIGAWGIGVRGDAQTPWLDASSFVLNGNRLAYYEGADVLANGNVTVSFTVKIAATASNGTYRLYYKPVLDYKGWTRQVAWNGKVLDKDRSDIFTDFYVGTTPSTGGGNLNVSVASTTPGAANVAELAADVPMARLTFAAGASKEALITSISVRKTGLSADTDISNIKLYDDATKLGSTQGINSTTHKATFTGLSWLIPAGTTRTLTIKATVPSAASVGDILVVGIESAADITLSGGGTVAGTFPAYGNNFTVGSTSVGFLGVTAPTTPAAANVISGSTAQELASFKFTASSTEGFDVNSITLTEIGTSVDSDVSNMKLTYVGNQIGSTVASLTNGKVTFTGSPLFTVAAGTNKTIYVVGDIASGVTSQRTIRFEINEASDVTAVGQSSGGAVTIDADAADPNTDYTVAQGSTMTIVQGSITIVEDPTNLAAQTYIIGQEQVEMSKFKFSAGSNEGVKITKVIFNEDQDAVSTDYQNARLYINDSATPIATGGSISTTTITFEDGNGLFEIPKSGNTVITLKIDISTAASADATFRVGIGTADNAYTNLVMYGATSGVKIDSDATHITTMTGVDTAEMSTHEINASGTFVVSNGPNTPAAANYSVGTSNFEFMQFRMQALSEAARVSAVTVRFFDNSAVAGDDIGNEVATGDVTNAKLYWLNGTTWTFLDDVPTPSSGVATFSFDHTIPRNVVETFKVVADIPTSSDTSAAYIFLGVDGTGDTGNIYDVVTAVGVSSGATLNSGEMTGSADSSVFTYTAPILTVLASTVPAARSIVVNSTDVLLGKFFLTANDVEDIRVSTLKISFDQDADDMVTDSDASTDLANVYLRFDDGGTWRTTLTKSITDGGGAPNPDYISFSGSDINMPNEWFAPKGGSIVVEVRGDVVGSTSTTLCVGMSANATDVVAAGMYSGTSATIYDSGNNAYDAIWESPEVTLASAGTLTVTAATDKPSVQQVTAAHSGTNTAPTFFRAKLAATNEDIKVDAIRAKVIGDISDGDGDGLFDDNFAGPVRVYEGGTIVNNALVGGTLVGSGTLAPVATKDAAIDIVFTTPVIVPVNGSKYLTLVADLNSVAGGADSSDTPYLGIDSDIETGLWTDGNYNNKLNIRATGVSSLDVITDANDAGATTALTGNAVYVVKTKLGMAVNSSSPSGTATRQANHTIMKLNMSNTSPDTDARFRAGVQYDTTNAATWAAVGGTTVADENTNYVAGTDSVSTVEVDTGVGDGLQYDVADTTTLDDYTRVSFWFRHAEALSASEMTFVIDDTSGLGSALQTIAIPALNADTWYRVDSALTGITGARYFGLRVITAAGVDNEQYFLDNVIFYNDSLEVDLSSDGGLFNTTGATNTAVYLKDASNGTTLATGYVSGGGTAGLSTSLATVTFIPTTEMTIPSSGKTYNIVADTTALMNAAVENLTMSIDLGSASTAGVITSGNVLWNDNSLATTIAWVDSPDSPLARSLNF